MCASVAAFAMLVTSATPGIAQSEPPDVTTFSVSATTASPDMTSDAALVPVALGENLRTAYGDAALLTGAAATNARILIETALARAPSGLDLAFTIVDRASKRVTTEHVRIPDGSHVPTPAALVAIVDRATIFPAPALAPAPIVALSPLRMPSGLEDRREAATSVLAQRLREAGFADVRILDASSGALENGARIAVIGTLVRTGTRYALRLGAFGDDRSTLADITIALGDPTSPPAAAVFAPFVVQSLALVPPIGAPAGPVDALVFPLESTADLADAASAARVALIDRFVLAGTRARAAEKPSGGDIAGAVAAAGAKYAFTGTLARVADGYAIDLVGHTTSNSSTVPAHLSLAGPALIAATADLGAYAVAVRDVAPPATHRLIFIPFANPSNRDGYIGFANSEYTKSLAVRGYTLAPKTDIEAIDARLEASDLCRMERADGILIGGRIDHDQEYHKGALRTAGSFLGFLTFGLANVAANALGNIASDDRYVNRASLAATLVDCTGKRVWGKTVQGGNSHYGRNAAAGSSGAISDAVGQLATSMLETMTGNATPASGTK